MTDGGRGGTHGDQETQGIIRYDPSRMTTSLSESAPGRDAAGDAPPAVHPTQERFTVLARRIGGFGTGSALLGLALIIWHQGALPIHHFSVFLSLLVHGVGLALLVLSATDLVRRRWWDATVAGVLLLGLTATFTVQVRIANRVYSTDSLAMMQQSAALLLRGVNPYTSVGDLGEAAERYGLPVSYVTFMGDGEPVPRIATYPALHIVLFAPFLAIGLHDLRWVLFLFEVATLALLWAHAPSVLRPLVLLPMMVNPDLLLNYTSGAVTDWLWVLPVVATVFALGRQRPLLAALCFGLAAAIKQQPWFLTPFLLVWVWQTARLRVAGTPARWRERLRAAGTFAVTAAGVFLFWNLPFLFADFRGWVAGTFQPLLAEMIPLGAGLSVLTQFGIAQLPREAYLLATFAVWIMLTILYARFFSSLQHAAWALAAVPLWFSTRSLHNYFVFWIPVLAAGAVVWWRTQAARPRALAVLARSEEGRSWRFGLDPHLIPALRLLGGAVVLITLLLGGFLVRAQQASPPLELRVRALEDPFDLGAVTSIGAEVTNRGEHPVEPRFSVQWQGFPYAWPIAEGPTRLLPGETARYTIHAPTPDAVPRGPLPAAHQRRASFSSGPFVVKVTDDVSTLSAVTAPVEATLTRPDVLNPTLGFWTALHPQTLATGPFRWTLVLSGEESVVERAEIAGVPAVVLRVAPDGTKERVEAGLLQQVPFPTCGLAVRLFRPAAGDGDSAGAFGVRIEDGNGVHPPLLYLFASRSGRGIAELPDGSRGVAVETPVDTWVTVPLRVREAYAALGWNPPDAVTVEVFVTAERRVSGTHVGYVSAVRGLTDACPAYGGAV